MAKSRVSAVGLGRWGQEQYDCQLCRERSHHIDRNCRKHFPADVDRDAQGRYEPRRDWWFAEYHWGDVTFRLDDISAAECPVSLITPRSMWLVRLLCSQSRVKEATGAALFGPHSGRWPAWWFDAVDVFQRVVGIEKEAADQENERRRR